MRLLFPSSFLLITVLSLTLPTPADHYLPGIQHPAADFGVGDSNPFSNADGSGFGWYNDIQSKFDPTDTLPALMPTAVHTEHPPLHDLNLKALMKSVASTVLVGHIRAVRFCPLFFTSFPLILTPSLSQVVGSPISIVNSHPFTFGRWLFLHNGECSRLNPFRRS